MNCPNCSTLTNPGDSFCKVCGTSLNFQSTNNIPSQPVNQQQNIQPNYNQQQSNVQQPYNQPNYNQQQSNVQQQNIQPNYNQQQSNVQQQNIQPNYNQQQPNVQQPYNQPRMIHGVPQVFNQPLYNNDEDLVDAYIGPNAYNLKNESFSVNTFLFGTIYTLYRKMWFLSLVWFISIIILSIFLPNLYGYISLAANIYISIQFKKMYLKHVGEQVEKIKQENPNMTKEQLIFVCSRKGGIVVWPVVLVVISIVFLGALIMLIPNI